MCATKTGADTQVRPYGQERTEIFAGAAPCGRPQAFPPQGGRWPEGPDEGADERGITPVGTLISLTSLDSFPLEGGSLFA